MLDSRIINATIASVLTALVALFPLFRRRDRLSYLFAASNVSLALWNIGDILVLIPKSLEVKLLLFRANYVAGIAAVLFFYQFMFAYVQTPIEKHRTFWRGLQITAIFLLTASCTPYLVASLDVRTVPFKEQPGVLMPVFLVFLLGGFLFPLWSVFRAYQASKGASRMQIKYLFLSFIFMFVEAMFFIASLYFETVPTYYYQFQVVYSLILAYAIARYRLMDINLVFRYATIYSLFAVTLAIPYSLVPIFFPNPAVIFLSVAGAFVVGPSVERKVIGFFRRFVDQLPPFRGRYQALAEVPGLQKAISSSANVKQWAKNVVDSLNRLVEIENVGIFIYDEGPGSYFAVDALGVDFGQMYYASPGAGHPLIGQLKRSQKILQKEYVDFEVEKSERQDVLAAMEMLKASLCVPFFSGGEMIGFVSVGRKLKRARTRFEESQVSEGAIEDLLKFPVGVTENVAYVTGLLREELGEGAGLGGRRVTEGLNRLVSRTDWVKGVPKPEALGLRCEGTALLHRWRQSGRLTPVERETLNAAMVAAVYRGELVDYEQEETFNDEDLRTIWGLIQGAEAALMVILVTLAGQMKTAEWAHDLRHPFTKGSFRMLDEVLSGRQGPLTEKQAQTLSLIRSDAHFVEKHITDIVAPETAGEMKIKKVSATGLVRWVETRYKYVAALSGIELKGVVPESEGWVLCDGELIQYRVFNNLMDNALRHTPRGGAIEVGYAVAGTKARCYVKNEGGPVIEGDRLGRLFERGTKKNSGGKGEGGLAGLGLFNMASVVEAHGGQVWARSSAEDGTLFEFTLPLAG